MKVRALFFASYAEAFGRQEQALDLPAGSTVEDFVAAIRREPAAAGVPPHPLVAVNQRYARPETRLAEGDEVALIPPVAGG